jgi:long-chain fatty acid transport protein
MVKGVSMKLIPALVLTVFSGAASASGFQLFEQNASGIGNAYAGSAAVAENASTIYFNPAGMTQLQKLEVSGGVSVVKPSFSFNNKGSSVDGLTGTGDGGDAGGWGFVPNGYASWGVTKDLYVGIGISAPFGLKTEYDDRWVGAAQSRMFEIKTINVNPSVAYRLNEKVSLGFGLNWQKIDATYERLAGINVPSVAKLTLSDDAWGWNAGALFTLSPSTKVGVSYRSTIKYKTEGHTNLNGAWLNDSKASLTLPDTAILSVTQKLSDRWEMLGDISWTGWSSIPKVDILRANGSLAQVLDTDFKDAWRVALGANYQLNSAWKLKYGIAYDQTPVRGPTTRLVSLPDNDRVWLSFGAQWAPDKAQKIDLGAAYIHVRDSKIRNDQTSVTPSRGYVAGEYSGNIWVLGAQYSYAF